MTHTPEYMKVYTEANKERLTAYRRAYYQAHKDDILIKNKQIRERNKEKYCAHKKEYYKANYAELRAKQKEYREENKTAIQMQKKVAHMKNRDRDLERSRRHYKQNKEVYKLRAKRQYEADKARHYQQGREWAAAHPEKAKAISKEVHRKYRSTPKGNLSSTISKRMNESLRKGMKAGRHWETLVDYTVDQLKRHLEKLFKPGMTWENYGTVWHIDHKIPIAAFNFERPDDIDFHLCWSLKNLRPLEAKRNMSKGARTERPIQPSLAMGM